jgi:hypothetical protein
MIIWPESFKNTVVGNTEGGLYLILTSTVQTVILLKMTKDSETEVNCSYNCNYDLARSKDSSSVHYITGIHEQFVDLGFVRKSDQSPTKIRR